MDKHLNSILAGMLIGIWNIALVSCGNKVIGSLLFSFALLSIINLRLPLYTGRIGKVITNKKQENLITILILNAFGSMATCGLFELMDSANMEKMKAVCNAKYGKSYLALFVAGILCNILIHIAVKSRNGIITIICIMCFILCGFEHSIADAGYLIFGGDVLKWLVIVAGNSVGGIVTEFLLTKGKPKSDASGTWDF
jgi:formate/nitrite transporter FocA (FNT family)